MKIEKHSPTECGAQTNSQGSTYPSADFHPKLWNFHRNLGIFSYVEAE